MDIITLPASTTDLPMIYQLFEEAIAYQRANNYIGWQNYDRDYLKEDVRKGHLYKILRGETILCIFSVCYSDPLIWREREKGDAIYLHRIVLNRAFKGEKLFGKVLDWAISHARENHLDYIRMDTWADNPKIINYYRSYGFSFIENYTTPDTEALPVQHRNLNVALLELRTNSLFHPAKPFPGTNTTGSMSPMEKVNILQVFSTITKYWSQKIIGQANGQLIKLAKGKGEINWHKHDDQDELFILYKGHLTIQLIGKEIEMYPNDLFIVPKGVEHCPKAHGDVEFLIMGLNITSTKAGGHPDNRDTETVVFSER